MNTDSITYLNDPQPSLSKAVGSTETIGTENIDLFNLEYLNTLNRTLTASLYGGYKKLMALASARNYIKVVSYNIKKIDKQLDTYKYADLSELIIFRPIGLKTTYAELITALEAVQSDVLSINDRILTPFSKWTGEIINDPTKLQRVTINQHFEFINADNYNKVLDKLFNANDTRDRVSYGSLFKSNKQVIESMVMLNDVIDRQNDLPANKLLKMVENAAKRTDLLTQRCSDKNSVGICSEASKKIISDVLYDIAQEITLYSRLSYLVTSTRNALDDSIDKLLSLD